MKNRCTEYIVSPAKGDLVAKIAEKSHSGSYPSAVDLPTHPGSSFLSVVVVSSVVTGVRKVKLDLR